MIPTLTGWRGEGAGINRIYVRYLKATGPGMVRGPVCMVHHGRGPGVGRWRANVSLRRSRAECDGLHTLADAQAWADAVYERVASLGDAP